MFNPCITELLTNVYQTIFIEIFTSFTKSYSISVFLLLARRSEEQIVQKIMSLYHPSTRLETPCRFARQEKLTKPHSTWIQDKSFQPIHSNQTSFCSELNKDHLYVSFI